MPRRDVVAVGDFVAIPVSVIRVEESIFAVHEEYVHPPVGLG